LAGNRPGLLFYTDLIKLDLSKEIARDEFGFPSSSLVAPEPPAKRGSNAEKQKIPKQPLGAISANFGNC
jgi:hypothetical protein